MASKNGASAKKVQVPPETARVLQIAQVKAQQLRAELDFLALLVRGYTRSIRLDPAKSYTFTQKGNRVFAEEVAADA